MDPNKADLDKDGKLREYEKTRGEAIQHAMAENEFPEMAHGRMACGCDHYDGLMADPMVIGTMASTKALGKLKFLDFIFDSDLLVTRFLNLVEKGHC